MAYPALSLPPLPRPLPGGRKPSPICRSCSSICSLSRRSCSTSWSGTGRRELRRTHADEAASSAPHSGFPAPAALNSQEREGDSGSTRNVMGSNARAPNFHSAAPFSSETNWAPQLLTSSTSSLSLPATAGPLGSGRRPGYLQVGEMVLQQGLRVADTLPGAHEYERNHPLQAERAEGLAGESTQVPTPPSPLEAHPVGSFWALHLLGDTEVPVPHAPGAPILHPLEIPAPREEQENNPIYFWSPSLDAAAPYLLPGVLLVVITFHSDPHHAGLIHDLLDHFPVLSNHFA